MALEEQVDPTLECHFRGHRDSAISVDFKPDKKQLVSGGLDCSVMLWNFKKNLRAFRFVAHKEPVTSVKFSNDGEWLASGSSDCTARLWTPTIDSKSTVVRQHVGPVRSVDFSPDDQRLLTASDDKSIKICDLKGLRFVSSMAEHLNWVRCARFSSDGRLIVSGSDDRTMKLWDPSCKSALHTFVEQPGNVMSVAFHPSDLLIASASANHVSIHDIRNQKLLQFYECDTKTVRSIAFHCSGRYVLSGSDDVAVRILDVHKGRLHYSIHGHTKPVNGVCFSKDGEYFSTAGADKLVMVWKTNLDPEELPMDKSIFEERRTQSDTSFREMDASVLIEDDRIEVTDVSPTYKTENFSEDNSGADHAHCVQAIQGLAEQVEILSKTVQIMEKRLELLENKLEQRLCDSLDTTLRL